uniref:Uncharacterized protein n=1 Tax=Pyxicephalus adspersus TaxID=30357 RepID=A0AAV3B1W5_PYXAD|nr:TPA: hypothetical protein GDO54_009494 [Pyxicephalus adspersus]
MKCTQMRCNSRFGVFFSIHLNTLCENVQVCIQFSIYLKATKVYQLSKLHLNMFNMEGQKDYKLHISKCISSPPFNISSK